MKMGTIVVALSALCLQASAAVSDFTRTVVSKKLNGWDGVQFIKWEKSGLTDAGRA